MSDVWERHFNRNNPGQLFDPENPAHHPDADPDGDGWTNLEESIAGTDPFCAIPPEGMVAVHITYLQGHQEPPSPEFPDGRFIDLAIISWDTLPGKQYTLLHSPDLTATSWHPVDAPIDGDGHPAAIAITLTDSQGLAPDRQFWRVKVADPHTDSDNDGLTDYEEYLLGTSSFFADTFGNGISDLDLYLSGQLPVGGLSGGSPSAPDPATEGPLYSIIFELEQEHRNIPKQIGFLAFNGPPNEHRYLTREIVFAYSINDSPRYQDIAHGEECHITTYLHNGVLAEDGSSSFELQGQS